MKIHKVGHSCVVVEVDGTRVMVDPGTFTPEAGVAKARDIAALIITHQHADHIEVGRVKTLIEHNPDLILYTNHETGEMLDGMDIPWQALGSERMVGNITVKAWEMDHHLIQATVPVVRNLAVLFNDTFLHPGDALFVPPEPVPILGMPFGPFASIGEYIDYGVRSGATRILPLHDGYMTHPNPYTSVPNRIWKDAGIAFEPLLPGATFVV